MCDTCGCGDPELVSVEVHEHILSGNERNARHNREHLSRDGTFAINLMGSPGSGKTALLEATAPRLGAGVRVAALSGDLATENDARRLGAAGIPSRAITTGSACHLDAAQVHRELHAGHFGALDLLFVENVGNLVCPAIYDLGQHANVVALALTEGNDKPLKYPVMFRAADLVLLTKADLLPHLGDVDPGRIRDNLSRVMPDPRMIVLSARSGEGMDEWLSWLADRRADPTGASPPAREGVRA